VKLVDNLAYTETVHTKHGTDRKYRIRTFSVDNKEQIKWHRPNIAQTLHILQGIGWKLQRGDEPIVELEVGKDYPLTSKGECRLIKGRDQLVIRIEELYQPLPRNPIL